MSIITIFLLLGILVIPLLAAFVFKSKADELKEQKPVQFIIYNLLILFFPLILLEVYFFILPDNWISGVYPLLLVGFVEMLVIRFLIAREKWIQMKQIEKNNADLARVEFSFGTCLILTPICPIFFTNVTDIRVYIAGFLILVFWIYTICTISIVSGKIKNVTCSH